MFMSLIHVFVYIEFFFHLFACIECKFTYSLLLRAQFKIAPVLIVSSASCHKYRWNVSGFFSDSLMNVDYIIGKR